MLSTFTYLYLCKQSAIAGALAFCSPWLSVSLSSWLLASFNAYVGKNHESLPKSKMGEVVLVKGEVTDKGAVYAHQLEQLSKPERVPGEDDEFLAGMQRTRKA
jgi:hypothetical protein